MEMGLQDRVAIVTAASRGLGRASAEALALEGARVVVTARSADQLEELAASLPTECAVVPGDLGDPGLPARLVRTALERFGRLDVLVANNGGPPPGAALDVDEDDLRRALEANLVVFVRLTRAAVSPMRDAGWGRICMIASGSVKQPMDDLALSNAVRPGLWGWAKTAAGELAGDGVTVNLICPGVHATERALALAREHTYIGDPADFGRVVAFMCSTHTGFMTGTAVVVDGGRVRGL